MEFFDQPVLVAIFATLHCMIGAFAAFIAQRKGYNFPRWLIFGLVGGTGVLLLALWIQKNPHQRGL
ncbi:hypothetical protein PN462_19360 [Spirulina sp. CS-785/01]|uniref:hypothetical protein n=1 Tax=Spirulina sp. CS-785/01 TaxID=3021716 RepID=UPI00232EC815|nr:hypothetical protein [Spirulina sp. CS-785/01]MDB9315282.1 hypothetical protein [Spirulina sp. CS-785/01]